MKQYIEWEAEDFQELDDRIADAFARLAALETQHDQAVDSLRGVDKDHASKLDVLGKARVAIEATLDAMQKYDAAIESWKGRANASMLASEAAAKDLDARLDKAEPVLVSMDARLRALESKQPGFVAADVEIDARADSLEAWKAQAISTLASYAARLSALEQKPSPPPVQDDK